MARRAGQLPVWRDDDGTNRETFAGERLMVELMAAVVANVQILVEGRQIPFFTLIPKDSAVGFDPEQWMRVLREKGWSVTLDQNSVTFAIVRG